MTSTEKFSAHHQERGCTPDIFLCAICGWPVRRALLSHTASSDFESRNVLDVWHVFYRLQENAEPVLTEYGWTTLNAPEAVGVFDEQRHSTASVFVPKSGVAGSDDYGGSAEGREGRCCRRLRWPARLASDRLAIPRLLV